MEEPSESPSRAAWLLVPVPWKRLGLLVAVGSLLVGSALVAYPALRERQLVRLLAEADEHEAPRHREQLERLLGGRSTSFYSRLLQDDDPALRLQAVEGLITQGGDLSLFHVYPLLNDSCARVRLRIIEQVKGSPVPPATQILLSCVRDEDDLVREVATQGVAAWLPEVGRSQAQFLAALVLAAQGPDPAPTGIAMDALRRFSGQDFGYRNNGTAEEQAAARRRLRAWWTSVQPGPAPAVPEAIPITRSDPAPDFAVTDTTGKAWSLGALRGRPFLLHFFGTWCGPCELEMDHLQSLHSRHPELPLLALGIEEKGPGDLIQYAQRKGLTYPMALGSEAVREAYGGIYEVPVTFLVDAAGNIRRRFDGSRSPHTYERAVAALQIRPSP